ncbi:Lysine-epsilon oxidase [Minicystis rosea]|nr:Lysine-epsilon oxidase [Minicystis rosea]
MKTQEIVRYVISPGLGVARVGSSPDEYYLAPEVPGQLPVAPGASKDREGRIKRQAARFRIYGLDGEGRVVKEITADDAQIEWRVHLANRKAGWYQFKNPLDIGPLALPQGQRNTLLVGFQDRTKLIIDPGSRAISGREQRGDAYRFDSGTFEDVPVYLGELRTDEMGRLLVFGGHGLAGNVGPYNPLGTFANNDRWYDDISDGPVRATVITSEGRFEAEPAFVNVAPPNFGPGLYGILTMYDVALDLFYHAGWLTRPERPSFTEHIYPIFDKLVQTQWVNQGLFMLFGTGSPADYTAPEMVRRLADPSDRERALRDRIFRWFRDPAATRSEPVDLPPFYGDALHDFSDKPNNELSMTPTQYGWLRQWAEGEFIDDWKGPPGEPVPLAKRPVSEQPMALARAALEEILGGTFRPGIEATWVLRHQSMWQEPFRLRIMPEGETPKDDYGPVLYPDIALGADGPLQASGPGTLSRWMGVPWQADAASCNAGYDASFYLPTPAQWAARIPNQVMSQEAYERLMDTGQPKVQRLKHFTYRSFWYRDLDNTSAVNRLNDMVTEWDKLGVVERRPAPPDHADLGLPPVLWVESERDLKFQEFDSSWQQTLIAEGEIDPPAARAKGTADDRPAGKLGERDRGATPAGRRRRIYRRGSV